MSLYAATKKANELMAHTYSHLFGLPTTGLRFFTVYGPWGRPDMALFLFTRAILEGRTDRRLQPRRHAARLHLHRRHRRRRREGARPHPAGQPRFDHTHPDPATSCAPYRIYNIGNHTPVQLMDFIGTIEAALGQTAKKNFLPMQDGDVQATYADVDDLIRDTGFKPATTLEYGIGKWVEWYRGYKQAGLN